MSEGSTAVPETVLVTGMAGFIGFHLAAALAGRGVSVVGLDNLNDYYDVGLKLARLRRLGFAAAEVEDVGRGGRAVLRHGSLEFRRLDLVDSAGMERLFAERRPDCVVHLAAQAGVRYSLQNPHAYIDSNVVGLLHVLEGCRRHAVRHLVLASSSSVYGSNEAMPFSERHNVDHPVSLYAATKKSGELMAHSYAHLYGIPVTALRFFTVYGPWGRPDMAPMLFAERILHRRPIDVFNFGRMQRDFTYIDDIVAGVQRVMERIPAGDPAWDGAHPDPAVSRAPYRVFNIGNHQPVELLYFIELLERHLGIPAQKNLLPMQPGDVPATYADVALLQEWTGFTPHTSIEDGVARFVAWFREYYGSGG